MNQLIKVLTREVERNHSQHKYLEPITIERLLDLVNKANGDESVWEFNAKYLEDHPVDRPSL
jgi:hypothetical protein